MTAAPQLRIGKPTFANALKLWPHISRDKNYLKIVRVRDGVASLTDGVILLRRSVMTPHGPAVPDGCYDVRLGGELSPTTNPDWMKYPDIDLCCPDGINPRSGKAQIQPLCEITNEALSFMVPLVQEIRHKYQGTVTIHKEGMYMRQNPDVGFRYPFNIPTVTTVNPFYLEFVLIEMLQYPTVYLLREHRREDGDEQCTPLIFGRDWANCGLVMPRTDQGDDD